MPQTQIHLLLNHVPIIGSLIASAILAWGMLRKNEEVMRVSFCLLIVSAIVALPVYFSGEGAEEAVEHLPGVVERLIEDHEKFAKGAFVLMNTLGLSAVVGLVLSLRKALPHWYVICVLLLSLVNDAIMAQTAHLGGLIRHSEIRGKAQMDLTDQKQGEMGAINSEEKLSGSESAVQEAQEHHH